MNGIIIDGKVYIATKLHGNGCGVCALFGQCENSSELEDFCLAMWPDEYLVLNESLTDKLTMSPYRMLHPKVETCADHCIVSKEKATELCRLTLEHGDSVDYELIDGLTDVVCDAFSEQYHQVAEGLDNPEIAKEDKL